MLHFLLSLSSRYFLDIIYLLHGTAACKGLPSVNSNLPPLPFADLEKHHWQNYKIDPGSISAHPEIS